MEDCKCLFYCDDFGVQVVVASHLHRCVCNCRVASTFVSLMMNGMCCVWQMGEEESRREGIRKDFRYEYERQRLLDFEFRERKQPVRLVSNEEKLRRLQEIARMDATLSSQNRFESSPETRHSHRGRSQTPIRKKRCTDPWIAILERRAKSNPPPMKWDAECKLPLSYAATMGSIMDLDDRADNSSLVEVPLT
jgi:hypothetical protein